MERVREYTLVKFSDGSETVVEPPELRNWMEENEDRQSTAEYDLYKWLH